jgi:hypothetical protein
VSIILGKASKIREVRRDKRGKQMFEYDGTEPLSIKAGDEIEVIDDIRRGRVIYFCRERKTY